MLRKPAPADKAAEAAVTYVTAMNNGDLATLRQITCGDQHEFYTKISDADYANLFASQKARNELVNISGVRAAKVVDGKRAVVEVNAFRTEQPNTILPTSINLQKVDGTWKVCSPRASASTCTTADAGYHYVVTSVGRKF